MVSNDVCGDGVTMEAVSESSVYRARMTLAENINRDCLKNITHLFLRLFNICGIQALLPHKLLVYYKVAVAIEFLDGEILGSVSSLQVISGFSFRRRLTIEISNRLVESGIIGSQDIKHMLRKVYRYRMPVVFVCISYY